MTHKFSYQEKRTNETITQCTQILVPLKISHLYDIFIIFVCLFVGNLSPLLLFYFTMVKHQHIFMFCFGRYESGTLAYIWPLGHVTLSLHGPFLTNETFVSDLLVDVSYPETPMILQDLHLIGNQSIQHFKKAAGRRVRSGYWEEVWVNQCALPTLAKRQNKVNGREPITCCWAVKRENWWRDGSHVLIKLSIEKKKDFALIQYTTRIQTSQCGTNIVHQGYILFFFCSPQNSPPILSHNKVLNCSRQRFYLRQQKSSNEKIKKSWRLSMKYPSEPWQNSLLDV